MQRHSLSNLPPLAVRMLKEYLLNCGLRVSIIDRGGEEIWDNGRSNLSMKCHLDIDSGATSREQILVRVCEDILNACKQFSQERFPRKYMNCTEIEYRFLASPFSFACNIDVHLSEATCMGFRSSSDKSLGARIFRVNVNKRRHPIPLVETYDQAACKELLTLLLGSYKDPVQGRLEIEGWNNRSPLYLSKKYLFASSLISHGDRLSSTSKKYRER